MGGQPSQVPEEKEIEDIADDTDTRFTNTSHPNYDLKDYRNAVVYRYCVLHLTAPTKHTAIPSSVLHLISSYIPTLFQIYKLGKFKLSSCSAASSRGASPSPSISSVSSFNSYTSHTSNCTHSHSHSNKYINDTQRLSDWETMLYSTRNLFRCNNKYFIRTANHEIYGMSKSGKHSLGSNILLMSNGICSGNIAIKYHNGYIYTSKIRGKSFNKFAALKRINITQIECGSAHSLFLSADGKVYAMGSNVHGQCGIGNVHLDSGQIAIVDTFLKLRCVISSVSCGYQHSCAVDSVTNKLYCFGDNTFNQCSSESVSLLKVPQMYHFLDKIDESVNIVKAECGKNFTCCLTQSGRFYGFGRNKAVLRSKHHRDDLMKNGVWYNTNRHVYRDFSVGLQHIVLISKFGDKIVSFGYAFDHDQFDSHLRVIGITDTVFEIDRDNFDGLHDNAQIHKVFAGMDDIIVIFKRHLAGTSK